MLKSVQPTFALDVDAPRTIVPQNALSRVSLERSLGTEGSLAGTVCTDRTFDIARFELVRQFVEHIAAQTPSAVPARTGDSARIDWEALEAAVAGASSLEQAIGQAITLADRMRRGIVDNLGLDVSQLDVDATANETDLPFFAFSVADIAPDFGDESRYRTRVAKKVAGIFANRRPSNSTGAMSSVTGVSHSRAGD